MDFIDIGVGDMRFWTFNVADTAVTVGAISLVLLLWRFESRVQASTVSHASNGLERRSGGR